MTAPPLQPSTPTPPADPVVAKLRADAAASVGGGVALIGGGVAVSLVTVLLLTVVFAIVVGLPGLGFTGWFVVIAAVYAGGAALWLRKRSSLFVTTAFEYVDPRQEWAGVGRYDGGLAGAASVVADECFFGPRMLMAGVQQTENKEPPSRERFFDRCALLLRQLSKAGEAVTAAQVRIGDDETPAKLDPVLNYLDRAGWIGVSSDRTRIWLSSRAKIDLVHLGVAGPPDFA